MMRKIAMAAGALGLAGALAAVSVAAPPQATGSVYVRSQGLYYATFAVTDLPPNGPFQLLEMGPNGAETDFGPGDPGYLGGRWMEDFDGDGVFNYFLCPLFGPGTPNP